MVGVPERLDIGAEAVDGFELASVSFQVDAFGSFLYFAEFEMQRDSRLDPFAAPALPVCPVDGADRMFGYGIGVTRIEKVTWDVKKSR